MTALGQGAAGAAFASGDEEENHEETEPHPASAANPSSISARRACAARRCRCARLDPEPNAGNRRSERLVRAVAEGLAAGRLAAAQPDRTGLLRGEGKRGEADFLVRTVAEGLVAAVPAGTPEVPLAFLDGGLIGRLLRRDRFGHLSSLPSPLLMSDFRRAPAVAQAVLALDPLSLRGAQRRGNLGLRVLFARNDSVA